MSLIGPHRGTLLAKQRRSSSLDSLGSRPCLLERSPDLIRNVGRTRNTQAQGFGQEPRLALLQDEEGLSILFTTNSSKSGIAVEVCVSGHLGGLTFRRKTCPIELFPRLHRRMIGIKGSLPCSLSNVEIS